MTPPKITIDTPPPAVKTSNEEHSAAATVTAAAGGDERLSDPNVLARLDASSEFGEEVSRFTGIFDDLDSMFQGLPTNLEDFRGPIQRFAERAGDAVANFTRRLEGDIDIGPCDMDPNDPQVAQCYDKLLAVLNYKFGLVFDASGEFTTGNQETRISLDTLKHFWSINGRDNRDPTQDIDDDIALG